MSLKKVPCGNFRKHAPDRAASSLAFPDRSAAIEPVALVENISVKV